MVTVGNRDTINAGTLNVGDKIEYGDYIYKYMSTGNWGVKVKDTTKLTYGEICGEICGVAVIDMYMYDGGYYGTFANCTSLQGTVTINATGYTTGNSYEYNGTFKDTILPITLVGNGSNTDLLNDLAATATNGNVIVQQ